MPSYRAFLLSEYGKAIDAKIFDCKNDEDALEEAKQYVDGCRVQVWQGRRLIGLLKDEPDSEGSEQPTSVDDLPA